MTDTPQSHSTENPSRGASNAAGAEDSARAGRATDSSLKVSQLSAAARERYAELLDRLADR